MGSSEQCYVLSPSPATLEQKMHHHIVAINQEIRKLTRYDCMVTASQSDISNDWPCHLWLLVCSSSYLVINLKILLK
jgi:hypothetical protein